MDKLTVDKAIKQGHRMVNYPVIAIIILGPVLTVFCGVYYVGWWIYLIGILLSFSGAWLWWSVVITKWRITAFGNCRNVHELKRRAISAGLIWPDGSWFEKTEIRNLIQKQKLKQINKKFELQDEPELMDDDGSVPQESKIYYSKTSLVVLWGFGLIGTGVGIYSLILEDLFIGCLMLLGSSYFLHEAGKKSKTLILL